MSRRLLAPAAACFALLLLGAGCALRGPVPAPAPDQTWNVFRRDYCAAPAAPGLLVKGSLVYSRTEPTPRSNRVLVSLWGDFSGPVRLDVSAGIGQLLALVRQDQTGLLVFYPSRREAVVLPGPDADPAGLGLPFPFSLNELARIAAGDFSGLVPDRFQGARPLAAGVAYDLDGSAASGLTLDHAGRPLLLEGALRRAPGAAGGWRLAINAYDETPGRALPQRLTLTLDTGSKGVLRIRSREFTLTPWPAAATRLQLPDGVAVRRLENGPRPDGPD